MRTIIAGGRRYNFTPEDLLKLEHWRTKLPITSVISGGATGADECGESFARANNIPLTVIPADWKKHGKAAGPIRNQLMAQQADALIAFPGGTGTANMISIARELGLIVVVKKDGAS